MSETQFAHFYRLGLGSQFTRLFSVVLFCSVFTATTVAQISPEDSLKTLKVPDTLQVKLWASEPMFANPSAIDVDSRGRVWIAEGLNYRFFRNGEFKRQPGADRIKILEDTDGDGIADKVKIFAENIYPVPMGLALAEIWEEGKYKGARVFTGNSPELLVLEDLDGDDVAEKRSPFLTGFGGIDHDHGVHGMSIGSDGKLYFTQGDGEYAGTDEKKVAGRVTCSVTDRNGRKLQNTRYGATYRVNLDGTELEMLANGQRNNYEACVDAFGNVFVSDNDDDGNMGSRMLWIMDDGDYGYRMPGTSRHWAEELPGIVPKLVGTGNGSPCGILIVESDALGAKYNGTVLQIDAGTKQINAHPLTRQGAAFRTEYDVLLRGDDPYFRPIDAAFAPDGSLLVCDWYDAGVGGHRFTDQSTGRIYRISTKSDAPKLTTDLQSVAGLTRALSSPNASTRHVARQALRSSETGRQGLLDAWRKADARTRGRILSALNPKSGAGQATVLHALRNDDPRIREHTLRILTRDCRRQGIVEPTSAKTAPSRALPLLGAISHLANDPDPGVRRELILAIRNVPTFDAAFMLEKLVKGWDGQDRFYLEALRLALAHREAGYLRRVFRKQLEGVDQLTEGGISLPPYFPTATNDAYIKPADQLPPADSGSKLVGLAWVLQRPECLDSLAGLLKKNPSPALQDGVLLAVKEISDSKAAEFLFNWFAQSEDPQRQRILLQELGRGLSGKWKSVRDTDLAKQIFTTALDKPELRVEAIRAISACGIGGYEERIVDLARSDSEDLSVRSASLEALGQLGSAQAVVIGAEWLAKAKDQSMGGALAIAGLAAVAHKDRSKAIDDLTGVIGDVAYSADLRRKAVGMLASDTPGALHLLTLHEKEKLPKDLTLEATFLLHNHPDNNVRRVAGKKMPLTAAGKPITNLESILALATDPDRGRQVFHREASDACARCHRVQGIGNWVGPDLSSIGTKYGSKELLYHILNPSGAIGDTYVPFAFALTDGTILTGLITDESPQRVTLKTAAGERVIVNTADVEERRPLGQSMMPENLAQSINEQQLADLVAYLSTLRQPVSEVGEYYVLGPLPAGGFDAKAPIHLDAEIAIPGSNGKLRWQQLRTSRDQFLDLSALLGSAPGQELFVYIPVDSPVDQEARIALTTTNAIAFLLNGKETSLADPKKNGANVVREGLLSLRSGKNDIVLRLGSGEVNAGLITTLIAKEPLRITTDATTQVNAGK